MPVKPRTPHLAACVVCGTDDVRTLSNTKLAAGEVVVVCGSHALAHDREKRRARTVTELCSVLGERRAPKDRRDRAVDELAQALALAFRPDRRDGSGTRPGRRRFDVS